MPEIEFKGKTVVEAINNGLSELGRNKDDVIIKIVSEGSAGLFGLMGTKPAVILMSFNDYKEACKKTELILIEILSKMGIEFCKIETYFKDNIIHTKLAVKNSSFIIGKNGQTLDSLEYITQIIVNKELGLKLKINLDCEDYRKKQVEKLRAVANKAVKYVNRTGKIYRFDPMSIKERKIVHIYLRDILTIESFSEGKGNLRKIIVKPASKNSNKAILK
jgi:spoIIIJ-associated protein